MSTRVRYKDLAKQQASNGVQTTRPKFLPIKDSVKESFRLFAKAMGATFLVDCGTQGCKALVDTFEVRNRLMHPKNVFALGIGDTEVKAAEEAIQWLNEQTEKTFDCCRVHIAAEMERKMAELGKVPDGKKLAGRSR